MLLNDLYIYTVYAFEDFFLLTSCESTAFIPWPYFPLPFSLLFFCACLSHTLVWLRGACDPEPLSFQPSEVITFGWDSTHPHRSPGEPRQADGSTLFPPACSVLFLSGNPAAGTAQRGWNGNYLEISVSEVAHISFSDSSTRGTQHRVKW